MNTSETILYMIEKGATVNEICKYTGLTNKQLFYRLNLLKIKGYKFNTKYYSDGEIAYNIIKKIFISDNESKTIIMNSNEDSIKILLTSDLHIGSKFSNIKYLDVMYDYCKNNNINIIINAGDVVNGSFNICNEYISNLKEQIDYFLKCYPFDKNILTFICFGNHDAQVLETYGIDISTAINNKRQDIVSLGYGIGRLNIQNDQLIVRHPTTPTLNEIKPFNNKLIIYGHSHEMKYQYYFSNKIVNVYLPPLSNMKNPDGFLPLPGMVELNIKFLNGLFNKGTLKHLLVNDKVYKINEAEFELLFGRDVSKCEKIYNIEDRIPYEKKLVKK